MRDLTWAQSRRSVAAVALAIGLALPATVGEAARPHRGKRARVTRVVDGDTVTARMQRRSVDVRLLGVDTPETVHPSVPEECFGKQASRFTNRKLDGQRVRLEFDRERLDRYGRTLAYVWLRSRLFNVVLVRRGFATVLIYAPNDRYADRLHRAEAVAREKGRGLWGACEDEGQSGSETGGTDRCDPAYPTVCIQSPPPDLDCAEIPHRNFKVLAPDPHGFDGNNDGRGCET